ncbi:hypothetical protein BU23DRAFT_380033, partial [Bimuria novae-zelandiae CBS 107.79]
DFDLIKRWLKYCQANHHECRQSPNPTAFHLQVIDSQTRSLVVITPNDPYAALSYVWG